MNRSALALACSFALVLVACKGEARKAPVVGAGSGSGPGSGSSVAAPVEVPPDPRLASLPGELWFVEDGPPHTLIRVVAGVRMMIVAPLFPSSSRLPDGRLVAIRSRGDGSPDSEQLVLVGADGMPTEIGPPAPQVRDPVVDRDGKWIIAAFQLDGHSDLHRIEIATAAAARLTNNQEGNFHPVRLGADAIAFVSSRDGDSELYRMPVAGGVPQRLTAFHKDDWDPMPSPDGKTIVFTSDREGPPRLCVIDADGTKFRRFTSLGSTGATREIEESNALWSPDGSRLAYLVREKGRTELAVKGLTGDTVMLTPKGASDAEPVWSPDGKWLGVVRSIGRDSQLVVIAIADPGSPIVVSRGAAQLPRWF